MHNEKELWWQIEHVKGHLATITSILRTTLFVLVAIGILLGLILAKLWH
jgi:hypothetical protein